jgi:hypothetical protein
MNKLAKEFTDGWKHYLDCINFGASALDAEAIQFMNEMPAKILQCVNSHDSLVRALNNLINDDLLKDEYHVQARQALQAANAE